jgi:hypothetical protein
LVILTRRIRGRPVFTERDWLFLFGHPQEKVLSLHLWLRFAALSFAVVVIGFIEGYVLLPFGLAAFFWCYLSNRLCGLARCAEVATFESWESRGSAMITDASCPSGRLHFRYNASPLSKDTGKNR